EIRKAGLYDKIWQAFSILLPVQTVGVMGDGRTYDRVLALRAVTSVDGMTADFYPFDMAFLGRAATPVINEEPRERLNASEKVKMTAHAALQVQQRFPLSIDLNLL
ncbi:MAG TPA: hypothetical protein VII21_01290, partial [Aestuariivirga sp.]